MKIGEAHQTAKVFEQSSFSAVHSLFEFDITKIKFARLTSSLNWGQHEIKIK